MSVGKFEVTALSYGTHLHTGHVGGVTTTDGAAVFPNAVVRRHER